MFNHDAIYRAYPAVKSIDDSRGAFDVNGNQITLDQALVDAAAIEVAAEQALSWHPTASSVDGLPPSTPRSTG
jgi:hypothetical protein